MKQNTAIYGKIPTVLYAKVVRVAKTNDLKLVAVLRQALELWLKENAA